MEVGDAHLFPGLLTPEPIQHTFKSQRLLFSHISEVRGGNTPERKFTSTGYRSHNHQVIIQTGSPLSHLGRYLSREPCKESMI